MDDELFSSVPEVNPNTQTEAGEGSPKFGKEEMTYEKSLRDVIIPLKIREVYKEHFLNVLQQNDIKLNLFILGYSCD